MTTLKNLNSTIIQLQRDHRVFPRIQLFFWGTLTWHVTEWAMALPEMSNAQSGMVAAVYAASAAYGKFYGETDPALRQMAPPK